jgi:hypothetical protein
MFSRSRVDFMLFFVPGFFFLLRSFIGLRDNPSDRSCKTSKPILAI